MATSKKSKKLGKGLDAIFGDASQGGDLQSVINAIEKKAPSLNHVEVPLKDIRPNPYQPRKHFDEEKLNELAQSIKEHGIFQPIILKESVQGYEIVAGERRYRAASIVGLENVPAIIVDFTDQQMMEIALLENIQREDLNAIEEALAYKKMIEHMGLTQEELAKKVGKSRSHITNILGILKLPKDVQNMVLENKISMGHARSLSKLENDLEIVNLAHEICDKKLSVRETEDIINNKDMPKKTPIKKHEVYANQYSNIQSVMREKIGTLVKISNNKVVIPFDSDKDLERILDILNIDINY